MNDDEKASTNLAGVADNKHKFTDQTCQAVLRMPIVSATILY